MPEIAFDLPYPSYVRPPVGVDLRLDLLQMGAADGEGRSVFQDDRTILHLHDMDHVDDAAPVDEDKFFRAQLKAYKITFSITLIALVILCQGKLFGSLEYTLIAVIIVLSLTLALGIFLPEYLLYRYDHDGQTEEAGE